MKYAKLELGTVEAVFNKLGGMEGAQRFLLGEVVLSESVRCWTEENGVIRFSVESDGTTGSEWIKWFKDNGYHLDSDAKALLESDKFKPTKEVKYEVCVLKGELYENGERLTKNIRADADQRKLPMPPLELACLIRRMFTNEQIREMGLYWLIIMHEVLSGRMHLLGVRCSGNDRWLRACYVRPGHEWYRRSSFGFLSSQVSSGN